jgi:hypothetical protein
VKISPKKKSSLRNGSQTAQAAYGFLFKYRLKLADFTSAARKPAKEAGGPM